jgi:hypothetical protein
LDVSKLNAVEDKRKAAFTSLAFADHVSAELARATVTGGVDFSDIARYPGQIDAMVLSQFGCTRQLINELVKCAGNPLQTLVKMLNVGAKRRGSFLAERDELEQAATAEDLKSFLAVIGKVAIAAAPSAMGELKLRRRLVEGLAHGKFGKGQTMDYITAGSGHTKRGYATRAFVNATFNEVFWTRLQRKGLLDDEGTGKADRSMWGKREPPVLFRSPLAPVPVMAPQVENVGGWWISPEHCPNIEYPLLDVRENQNPNHGDVCRDTMPRYSGWICPKHCISTGKKPPFCMASAKTVPCRVRGGIVCTNGRCSEKA